MSMSKFMQGSPILSGSQTVPGETLTPDEQRIFNTTLDICRAYGLDFYPTIIQKLNYDEMSEIAAYGGFPRRYPHWKFGMEYEELQRGYAFGFQRIYEMVINTSPCLIYILNSNTLVDNVTVVAHATGHNDFFKNNLRFAPTDTGMLNKMGNHGTRIRRYMDRWGHERVTAFIDTLLRLDTLIDPSKAWDVREIKELVLRDKREYYEARRVPVAKDRMYMDPWLNTREFVAGENERVGRLEAAKEIGLFTEPTKDIFGFLKAFAPLKPWQEDIADMLYQEALYFAPQRATKVGNEGWACIANHELVFTNKGLMEMGQIVNERLEVKVSDGEQMRPVTNWFKHEQVETVKVTTRRGYELDGSATHRVIAEDGSWRRLDELGVGAKIKLQTADIWSDELVELAWTPAHRMTCKDVSKVLGKDYWRFREYRSGSMSAERAGAAVVGTSTQYDASLKMHGYTIDGSRKKIDVPSHVTPDLGAFLGYMIGDGHISDKKRTMGLTTGDKESVCHYELLTESLFALKIGQRWDPSSKTGRWRLSVSSRNLQEFLMWLGLKTGICARQKEIPLCVMRSPKAVMTAFLRAYFDCDGYAGESGVILSTASEKLGQQVQTVLLNYGILSTRRLCAKNIWQVSVTSANAKIFQDEIGFGLSRKSERLNRYVCDREWFCKVKWTDDVVSVTHGVGDVYDITVEGSHRYAAKGFLNHNSHVDYEIMARQGHVGLGQKSHETGIIQYATHKAGVLGPKYGMNPYKLGFCLLLDIEERWNKGQFGAEYDNCRNLKQKEDWDLNLGLGKEKLFEVRKYYDDVGLISEFFTPEFCEKYEFFEWKKFPNGEYRIESRDHKKIKQKLLHRHINGGLPDIRLADPNHRNKGWLLLQHEWDGRVLHEQYARDTLTAIYALWQREVVLATRDSNNEEMVFVVSGDNPKKDIALVSREDYEQKW